MFEKKKQRILHYKLFVDRLFRSLFLAVALLSSALLVGICGYHYLAKFDWIDSLLNASMILSGMGPIDQIETISGKLFASAYAIFSGVIFLSSIVIVITPLFHRFLHNFHVED